MSALFVRTKHNKRGMCINAISLLYLFVGCSLHVVCLLAAVALVYVFLFKLCVLLCYNRYKLHVKRASTGFPTVITIFSAPNYVDIYGNKGLLFVSMMQLSSCRFFSMVVLCGMCMVM